MFAILSSADYYKYTVDRKGNSMGVCFFLSGSTLIVEMLLYIKHLNPNDYKNSLPFDVKLNWVLFFAFVIVVSLYLFIEDLFYSNKRKKTEKKRIVGKSAMKKGDIQEKTLKCDELTTNNK